MFARVMHLQILPGKLDEFVEVVESLRPSLRKQAGFRAMMILCSPETPIKDSKNREISASTYTVWDSMEDMRASEKNMFLYQALARMKACCKGFPQIHEEAVIASEIPSGHTEQARV